MDQPNRIRLLYIAGETRSGTTLLDRVLGQTPGLFSVGELAWLWNEALGPARPGEISVEVNGQTVSNYGYCGCAAPIRDCVVWRQVFDLAFGGFNQIDPADMFRQQLAHRPRQQLRRRLRSGRTPSPPGPEAYLNRMERLYRAIRTVTGCDVIVESSKDAAHLAVLAQIPALDVRVLHVVRDPRAVAYSVIRRPLGFTFNPLANAGRWNKHNLGVAWVRRWRRLPALRLRYEDFVAAPRPAAQRVLDFVGSRADLPQFRSAREVELAVNHTVYGNPNRFFTGAMPVRLDDEWTGRLSRRHQAALTLLTLPLLAYYRYPLFPRPASLPPAARALSPSEPGADSPPSRSKEPAA